MKNAVIAVPDSGIFDLVTPSLSLWSYSRFNHRLLLKGQPRKAYQLNRYLGTYPGDVTFTTEDEPLFPFTDSQTNEVLKILGSRGKKCFQV